MSNTPPIHVLAVEDDLLLLELLITFLKRASFKTSPANSVVEALEIFSATPDIDVVLSDRDLNGESGIKLLVKIQQLKPNARLCVLSGGSTLDIQIEFNNLGGSGDIQIFEKPYNRKALMAWIQTGTPVLAA